MLSRLSLSDDEGVEEVRLRIAGLFNNGYWLESETSDPLRVLQAEDKLRDWRSFSPFDSPL